MILLIAFGKPGYAKAAYNLAFSLKHFSPDIPITIFHDGILDSLPEEKKIYFDEIRHLEKADPAKIKSQIYDISPFEETLYLDVDGIALKDISPLIAELKKHNYYTHVVGEHKLSDGNKMSSMLWAYADDIVSHYGLDKETILPATNSSIVWFKKCDEVKNLYEQLKSNLANPIPLKNLRYQWGGTQPDELYLNIALAQTGIKYPREKHMFFGPQLVNKTFEQIVEDNYFLSTFGGRNFTKLRYTEWYDRRLFNYHKAHGLQHSYLHSRIIGDKHANKSTPSRNRTNEPQPVHILRSIVPSKIPIAQTTLIDSSKLIQHYTGWKNETVKITNWFNCSVIEHHGKYFFAYRMDSKPFCQRMKIGLCLLDNNLQPIKESNVLLNLHSDVRHVNNPLKNIAAPGWHVEDPRLFIFNDELYLNYTDGWQMALAKINPVILQAEESYYLEKPDKKLTEKNWTFFQHEEKLYCLYDLSKQEIFEMNGRQWERKYITPYQHEWKYGIIRGGTNPVRVGDRYLTFFHSAHPLRHKNRNGKQYFMGAILFEAKPPFKVVSISKEPLLTGEWVSESIPRLSPYIYVVFPNGKIRVGNSWIVSFGYNDLECRMAEVTDAMLKENMIEIKYPQQYSSAHDTHEKVSAMDKGFGHIKLQHEIA